jgi:hypothetical protein
MEALVIYEDYPSKSGGIMKYKGEDKLKLLKRIVEDHSYPTQRKTEKSLLKHLEDNNGDGCDFIFAILLDNKPYYLDTFLVEEGVVEVN